MLVAPRHSAESAEAPTPAFGWPPARPPRWPLLAAALLVLAAGLWATRSTIVDDAFITYRYSANLAHGFGPVWNPGLDPVEGYTNFAWMVWHAPFVLLGAPLTVVSKLTAAACAAGIVWLLVREPRTTRGAVGAAAVLLLFLPTYIHTTSGLETVPYALVLLRAVVLAVRVVRDERMPRRWELPALLLLAGLLRPDGLLAVAPAFLVWLWASRRDRAAWGWTASAAVVGAGYVAWRWAYFGHLMPNTFVVKALHEAALTSKWTVAAVAVFAPLLLLLGSLAARRRTRPLGWLLAATVVAVWAIPAVTAPAMDYSTRFAWHALPVLCLAAGLAVDRIRARGLGWAVVAATAAWSLVAGLVLPDSRAMVNAGPDFDRAQAAIGRGLATSGLPGDSTLATAEAGAIPYFSGWRAIDYGGLCDEAIARGANPAELVARAAPTVIVVPARDQTVPDEWWGMNIPQATAGYELADTVQWRGGAAIHLFTRPENAAAVRDSVREQVQLAEQRGDGRSDYSYRRWVERVLP